MGQAVGEPGFLRGNPLVLAAGLFLYGVVSGRVVMGAGGILVVISVLAWGMWVVAEWRRWPTTACTTLGLAIFSGGALLWVVNQGHVEATHIARLAPDTGEQLVVLRAEVLVAPPENAHEAGGNRYWIGRAQQVWAQSDGNGMWIPATGDIRVKWSGQRTASGDALLRGMQVEVYGWLSRPPGAMNPGAIDEKQKLAADRIFAAVRVPRAAGVVLLNADAAHGVYWLTKMRTYLRSKLLEHTIQQDVPAAYTLSALLLGNRDPAIGDVSQAFSDAGVAHLLAISGSHVVFFAGMVWTLLRFVPMRPRQRELVIAAVVLAYVLATPCGPPIVRAGIAVVMVVVARMLGRPRAYLNMLAAAAVIVVLMRPADIADAGFRLTFVTTVGLIVLSERVHKALFGDWLARETLFADLRMTRASRRRVQAAQFISGALTANIIGAMVAGPLVALHFSQINPWAMVTGQIATPIVMAAMAISAVQLAVEVIWSGAGAALSPLAAATGRGLIWVIQGLANLPGAAVSVRPLPGFVVAGMYGVLVLWMGRRKIGVSRAMVVNAAMAMAIVTVAWMAMMVPVGKLQMTVLDAGAGGSAIVMRTPAGGLWVIDAGAQQGMSVLSAAIGPLVRREGARRLSGELLTALDTLHAGEAGPVARSFGPPQVFLPAAAWDVRGQTLAGAQMQAAAIEGGIPVKTLHAGQTLDVGSGCTMEVLWPPEGPVAGAATRKELIGLWTFEGKRLLVMDPAAGRELGLALLRQPGLRCDAIVMVGSQRGAGTVGDDELRRLIGPLGATQVVWCGRTAWTSRERKAGEWNTAEGAVKVEIGEGHLRVGR